MKGLGRYLEQIQISKSQEIIDEWQEGFAAAEPLQEDAVPGLENSQQEDKCFATNMLRLERMISRNTLLKAYRFTRDELLLLAQLCHKSSTNGEQDFNPREICAMLPAQPVGMEEQFAIVVDLLDREILSAPYLHEHDYHYDPRALLGTSLRLNGLLWNLILGRDPIRSGSKLLSKAQAVSGDLIDAVLKALGILFLHYPELAEGSFADTGACFGQSVNAALDAYLEVLAARPDSAWKAFQSKHRLSLFWQKCLLLIHYYNRERDMEPGPAMLASVLARNSREKQQYLELLGSRNILASKSLIVPPVSGCPIYQLELTKSAIASLHGKTDAAKGNAGKAEQILANSAYLSRIDPAQTLDQLILDSYTRGVLVTLLQRLKNPRRESFAEWGLLGASLSGDPDVQNGCNVLLHGVPGTGKSFIAGVLANELRRPLVQINANSIRGILYGSTEKQARELFQELRALAKLIAPVFLLNEGDQLLHQRIESPERSVDHAENAIQSVFLEELESFPGIFIVTTNLRAELDPAMSRRFHYKLEIRVPDQEARIALWRLHLPQSIPGAQDIPVQDLARDFHFTGGQIRLVVLNACHEAFLRGRNARLNLADLYKYAALECGTSFEQTKRQLGFAC